MMISRRSLLQYTSTSCALALLAPVQAGTRSLRMYEVRDGVAAPRFIAGTRVIADASMTAFDGDGLYLYPAWGTPRLYAVHAVGTRLEFRNPGSGVLLWTQTAGFAPGFAGKVMDTESRAASASAWPALRVPTLPA